MLSTTVVTPLADDASGAMRKVRRFIASSPRSGARRPVGVTQQRLNGRPSSLREKRQRRLVSREGIVSVREAPRRGVPEDVRRSQRNEVEVVSQTFSSWNRIGGWLARLDGLRGAA